MTQPRDKAALRKKRKREPSILTEKGILSTTNFLQQYRVQPVHEHQAASKTVDDRGQVVVAPDSEPSELKKSLFFSTGFLGPSSFWAAFDESDESRATTAAAAATTHSTPTQASENIGSPSLSDTMDDSNTPDMDQIECGARVLVLLEDLALYQKLLQYRFNIMEPLIFCERPVNELFAGLFALRQQWRQGNKLSQSKLLTWSEKLFENSAKRITTHKTMTVTEYFASIAARWESVGLIFSLVAVTALIIPDGHEILRLDDGSVVNVHKLIRLSDEVSEICLGFCESVRALSDPLFWLLLQRVILLGEIHGDSGMFENLTGPTRHTNLCFLQIIGPGKSWGICQL
jgi:chromatin structure-remodeling complex subunit RSC3/30